MTWPTPILVWKSPRPTEESNLPSWHQLRFSLTTGHKFLNALLPLLIRRLLIVEVAGVLHSDGIAGLGLIDAIAGRDLFLGDTHGFPMLVAELEMA